MNSRTIAALFFLLALGCTTITVDKIDRSQHPVEGICIRDNPDVIVPKFRLILEQGFEKRGIRTHVFQGARPEACEYMLTYTALRAWDLAPFLNYAELTVYRGHRKIAQGVYEHSGGLALNKWAGVESKMSPVIDRLLEDWP